MANNKFGTHTGNSFNTSIDDNRFEMNAISILPHLNFQSLAGYRWLSETYFKRFEQWHIIIRISGQYGTNREAQRAQAMHDRNFVAAQFSKIGINVQRIQIAR